MLKQQFQFHFDSSRGISTLIRECQNNIKQKVNMTLKEKLKTLGNTFYNGTEISAQEAAWCRLKLPMTKGTRVVVYINTSPINERARILKPAATLKKILSENPNSTDIYSAGDIDRYMLRPVELNNICLAKFVSDYTYVPSHKNSRARAEPADEESEENIEDNEDPNELDSRNSTNSRVQLLALLNGYGFVKIRKQSRVIRYRKYNLHQDRANYFRELIMLYHPWRDEGAEVENANCESIFRENKESIEINYKPYNDNKSIDLESEIENAIAILENISNEEATENNSNNNDFNPFTYNENIIQPDILRDIVGMCVKSFRFQNYSTMNN